MNDPTVEAHRAASPATETAEPFRRRRRAKIVATLGPSSGGTAMIRSLFLAGVDVFRLNFSHGTHDQHRERLAQNREVEHAVARPIGVLADLQGPKLRIGAFASGPSRSAREAGACPLTLLR